MMTTNTIPQKFDGILDAIQAVLMSFLVKLGPFFVALMPALFTAYAIFHTFRSEAGQSLALFFSVVVGLAMETVGIVSVHTTIDLYNAWQDGKTQSVKFWLMACLIPVYVVGVSAVVYFSENAFTDLVKGLGIASPFLTCIVYIAVALARDIKRTEDKLQVIDDRQTVVEAEQREWQREKERLELQYKQEAKLARIEAKRVQASVQTTVQDGHKNTVLDTWNVQRQLTKEQRLDALLDIYLDNPHAPTGDVMTVLGVKSRQTIYNYLDELEDSGKIRRNNGQGVEVLA